ncbi:mechanosensitive ion channel family protein [Dyella mobilis]|uniref:Mechanosensitive ion channel n=1 Tax=Dyella mobilis TaxID=1849582 RepID=A0ABS2KES0_9GAMM|nr:mechanosensitive ion channel family protein [Dyella mobilis]MBM7128843.1 mechanosensitive ion channel [Dyella mobilis]
MRRAVVILMCLSVAFVPLKAAMAHVDVPIDVAASANTPFAAAASAPYAPEQAAGPAVKGPSPAAATAAAAKSAPPTANKPVQGPLQANGLIARTLHQVDRWASGLGAQFNELTKVLLGLIVLLARSGGRISDTHRQLLLHATTALVGSFVAGLAAEWLLHRALRHPLQWLAQRADKREEQAAAEDARRDRDAAHRAEQERRRQAAQAVHADAAAGTRPRRADVALVAVQHNGVQRVEEVLVGKRNTDSDTAIDHQDQSDQPAAEEIPLPSHRGPARYMHALRRMMHALFAWVLDLLPLALFLLVSALVLHGLSAGDQQVYAVTGCFVNAYVTTRVVMATLRLFLSPASSSMRVVRITAGSARILQHWGRGIVALIAFGIAVGNTAQMLGVSAEGRMAFIKLISLFVHVAAALLVFRLRRPARRAIAAAPGATGTLATLRNGLARAWLPAAVVLIMGAWVVWALGVEDGFPKLIHFMVVTAAIVVASRVATILLQGLLGRFFHLDPAASKDGASNARARLTRTYFPLVKGLVSVTVTVCALLALFQAWGLDALDWFSRGAIGRGLMSAAVTILVATVVAVSIWEGSSVAIERRIDLWTERGDRLRAARLRTLLPMLRTGLFIGVVLVVGLTALNEIGVNTTPLLASASIVGVALGFGSQKLVQDFITGMFLLMENAMQVGDWVTVAGVSGTVENLSVRTVRLRGGDGSLYTVPFSSVTTVNNTHRGLGNASVSVSVTQEIDIERAIEELKSIGAELRDDSAYRKLILKDMEVWGVDAMDGSKITLIGQMQCTDDGRWGVQREINARIIKRFREKSIELANPRTSFLLTPDALRPPSPSGEESGQSANS